MDDRVEIGRRLYYCLSIEPLQLHSGATSPASNDDAALGGALRGARKARGLSLAQVADATGISRSLLSLIETGRSDITIGRLGRLARLYEIRMADLVTEPRHADPVIVRAAARPGLHYTAEGINIEILVPQGRHVLHALLATFAPHARMEDSIVEHNEQFVHVVDGHIRTEFGDGRVLELHPGDSATFTSGDGGHRHANLADQPARMLIVLSRPQPR
jgi:transcriptional regulator with XRE-family HTH domain